MRNPVLAALIGGLIFLAWAFRYEYHEGPLGIPLRTNRYTGQVEKFWSEPDKQLPANWYPVPMGEASRQLQIADEQAKAEEERRKQERAYWERRHFSEPSGFGRQFPSAAPIAPSPGGPPGYRPRRYAPPRRWYPPPPPPSIRPPIREWKRLPPPDVEGLNRPFRQY